MQDNFFSVLPGFRDFGDLSLDTHYTEAPSDWSVIITDIEGSTKAIEAGKYKTVNMVGASTIAAILNAVQTWDLPFVFGGDGATALVPNYALPRVQAGLAKSKELSEEQHELKLRIGIVPHGDLLANGSPVKVAKYMLGDGHALAFFKGRGLTQAETWVKSGRYLLSGANGPLDFEPHQGLSCRWAPLNNERGLFLSVLVKVEDTKVNDSNAFIREIVSKLDRILDLNSPAAHPVKVAKLRTEKSIKAAKLETSFFENGSFCKNLFFILFVKLLNAGWLKLKTFDMQAYKASLAPNSDYRKFDEILRMVVDCTPAMRDQVHELLAAYHLQGAVYYGLHESETALMTCFVENYKTKHIHFIDGGDGGYANAARQLKAQVLKAK